MTIAKGTVSTAIFMLEMKGYDDSFGKQHLFVTLIAVSEFKAHFGY